MLARMQRYQLPDVKGRRFYINLIGVGALLVLYFLPESHFSSNLNEHSYCLHKQLTGIDCPGCGFTRATYYFLHLEFKSALKLNCCVVFLYPILLAEIAVQIMPAAWVRKARLVIYLCFCISLLLLYLFRIFNH